MLIKGSFKQQNILWEVYFKSDLYPEVSLEIGSSPDGLFEENQNFQVYFSTDAVEVTTESPEDTFAPIIKHSATVNLLTKTYIGQYFWSESPIDIRAEIFRNKEIIFSGFVTQGSYSQSYADCYDELNISCVDYLSVLEYYNYADISHNYDSYKTSATNVSFQNIFNNLLIDGLDFNLGQKSSLYYDQSKDSVLLKNTIFDDIEFSELNFLGDDEDSVDTKEDVLSKILTYLNLHIVQLGKDYLIFDWDFINNVSEGLSSYIDLWDRSKTFTKSLLTSANYPELIKRFHYSSSSTNLSIADVYNKIQVNCSLDSTDDAIVSPFDNEITTKIYPRKYLYQTEILSPGKGFGAAKEFLEYVKYNDKSVDDDFTVIDYYIQQISNPAWTLYGGHDVQEDFTVVHQDILKYVPYNSKGEAYKAYYIPSEFPERFGVTALYSIGCIQKKQADINSDMSKISPNSLQMSPYIVISVNGNGDNSENGHKPTDQNLIDAVPIAEYTGNISGGVYSPTDDDTINYMIFTGKIMFVPRVWSELTYVWDVVKQFDNFMSLLTLTVPYYKDDGKTFRTNKFYTVDNPVSIQDDSKFDGSSRDFTDQRRSPYLDLSFVNSQDKAKWFQYNYTRLEDGSGSSIDNIKKLSVFECQLVIGDKTFVETVNSDGSSTYSWETYNPDYDKTVNQQSFTLGIDPNKGDYILGQDFEIENNITFDMNLGSNKGFAIPIKKSDNLKGNIVFKILGPFQLQWNDITKRHKTMFRHTKYTDHYKYVLANCSSIVIKDFNCKLISDNSGLEVNNEKDLIYVSTEDKKFTNSYETDFDITSGLSSQECYEKQINNKIYMNYPVTTKGEVVTKIVNKNYQVATNPDNQSPIYLQDKPEKFYIDQYFREYSKPRIIFQVPVREKLFTNKPMIDLFGSFVCFQTFRDRSFKLIGIDYSSDDETPRNLTFKELPEEFGKPADDYDWTDNSDTGGEVEIDKGGPNESIDCDPAKIGDYFTITNTGLGNEVIDVTITINSDSRRKHFYYTTDDLKWIKSTDNSTVSLRRGDKVRLRCIFNGGSEVGFDQKPYLTFSSNDSSLNVSGDIQSLSAGDDFKNQQNLATYCNGLFRGFSWTFNGLVLSSKNISSNCYQSMFENCSQLTTAPDLPATVLKDYCYSWMFYSCNNLQKIANFSWIQTAYKSCECMYSNCQGLTQIPNKVFSDNIKLTDSCYYGMFQGCIGIKTVTISKLDLSYANDCFTFLFQDCTSLSEIVYYPRQLGENTEGLDEYYTNNWVSNVSPNGIWYNATNQGFTAMSDSLIPNGWLTQEGLPIDPQTAGNYFTITNLDSTDKTIELMVQIDRMFYTDDDHFWKYFEKTDKTAAYEILSLTLHDSQKIRFKANNQEFKKKCFYFSEATKKLTGINVSGNIQTLSFGDDYKNLQNHATYCSALFSNCVNWTFNGLTLPATKLTDSCYNQMFYNCQKIVEIPEGFLPATTATNYCYSYMFAKCSNLLTIPESLLPATTLSELCYSGMFSDCQKITKSPVLPARTMVKRCYERMFANCSRLEEITFNGDKLDETVSEDWVKDIYTYGKFISTNKSLPNYEKGFNTIPVNWIIDGAAAEFDDLGKQDYFTLTNTTSEEKTVRFKSYPCKNVFIKFKNYWVKQYFRYQTCDRDGNYFVGRPDFARPNEDTFDIIIKAGERIQISFDVDRNTFGDNPPARNTIWKFDSDLTGINLSGNVWSLFYGSNYDDNTNKLIEKLQLFVDQNCTINGLSLGNLKLSDLCYEKLFVNCKNIVEIPEGLLPATKLEYGCYRNMFLNCTGLKQIPEGLLPATKLANACYREMFSGCSGLKTIPEGLLPATNLTVENEKDSLYNGCYCQMFLNCSGLKSIPEGLLPATVLSYMCYEGMFENCSGLEAIPKGFLPATVLTEECYNTMFSGCSGLTAIPESLLPATNLNIGCYRGMFNNCKKIIEIPEDLLPATTLQEGCYTYMFSGCSGLTNISENLLHIQTLSDKKVETSYNYMFSGCSGLSVIHEGVLNFSGFEKQNLLITGMFTGCTNLVEVYFDIDIQPYGQNMFSGCTKLSRVIMPNVHPDTTATNTLFYYKNWLQNVSTTGTIVTNQNIQFSKNSMHSLPAGWSVSRIY